jgi:hypothetical protein
MTKSHTVLHSKLVSTVLQGVEKLLAFKGESPSIAKSNNPLADEVEHLNNLLSAQEESHGQELEKSRAKNREIESDFCMVYELVYERINPKIGLDEILSRYGHIIPDNWYYDDPRFMLLRDIHNGFTFDDIKWLAKRLHNLAERQTLNFLRDLRRIGLLIHSNGRYYIPQQLLVPMDIPTIDSLY